MFKFEKPTKDKILKKEEAQKEIENRIKSTGEIGRRILSSPDGQKYREAMTRDLKYAIKALFETPPDSDPVKDTYFLRTVINKLGHLYELLEEIERDAHK